MKKLITLGIIAMFTLMVAGVDYAEAKRFGMGSSFGKQRMSKPKSNSFSQQKAAPQKQAAAGNQRGAARGGMMGMLGGLALGGLLGAMFFGGAFEGINFFDILMIGGVILLLFLFLRRRSTPAQPSFAGAGQGSGYSQPDMNSYGSSNDDDSYEQSSEPVGTVLRPEIDEKQFTGIAKEIYIRMQTAWDSGDIEDVRKFCTPEIAERIGNDMSPNNQNSTEVAMLNAEVADSWIESDLEWVAVSFTGMLREKTMDHTGATVDDQSAEVSEVWIFQHAPNSDDPTWYLAGIQQTS